MVPQTFDSFAAFYPFYLGEHRHSTNRRLHFVGTTLVIAIAAAAIATTNWAWLWGLPLVGYGPAWVGHFAFEKNRPATFRHPLYSLLGDFRMYFDIWRGRLPL